jgi:hypothetical protein
MMRVNAPRIKRYSPSGLKSGSGQVLPNEDNSHRTMVLRLDWNRRNEAAQRPGARLAAFQRRRTPDSHQRYFVQFDGGGTADWGGEMKRLPFI